MNEAMRQETGRRRGTSRARMLAVVAVLSMATGALSGCNTSGSGPAVAALPTAPLVVVTATDLVGNWGLASYRDDKDRERTAVQAKAACNNPYVVGAGANGGAMMYLADQTQPSEVFVKTGPGGQVYIGPQGPAAVPQDRLVVSYENNVLITQWLDAGVRERYGTMIFVRCGVA